MILTLIFTLLTTGSQLEPNDSLKNQSLEVFSPNKIYEFQASYINSKGDTLTKEWIELKPFGKPWKFQKTQTAYIVYYHFTKADSLKFLSNLNPVSKNPKKPKPYFWSKTSGETGALENDTTLWMHPFRENQYVYTEIAPFPEIRKKLLKIDGEWKNGLGIYLGWGNFKGKVFSTYTVLKKENRTYGNLYLKDCWLIHAVGKHNKLGKSYLDFYYHPEYGFVEMNYTFYDGVKINFVLKSVTVKNNEVAD
ncbi:hypothetical protein I5M32_05765 [Pedobacter sp. SD-b]|uniref:Uncharacterized protein n=1 Tax=Pedobacter segetis TaxID=2793069 RepID=A0ABS1BHZ7_9SPHI|nr:hypothetical protein [Pedobacter segetis]MBK0382463.1 hypothetical protein [Pedobacter segetis]